MTKRGDGYAHQPTAENRRVVWIMSATGIPRADIATALGITQPTLRKHYADELKTGKLQANANVAGRLYAEAMRGHVRAQMFWLRCQAGWAERAEISGPDGGAIEGGNVLVRFEGPPDEPESDADDESS